MYFRPIAFPTSISSVWALSGGLSVFGWGGLGISEVSNQFLDFFWGMCVRFG
jgi:hypothetical protein